MSAWNWIELALVIASWAFMYDAMMPVKDYYIVHHHIYGNFMGDPWRGEVIVSNYYGFDDYLAAKQYFERSESLVEDSSYRDDQYDLLVVHARSQFGAIARLRSGKAHVTNLHYGTAHRKRRAYWQNVAKENPEYYMELAALMNPNQ